MSDTMWVDVNEVIKSYKAAGMECQIMSDKRPTDTLIVRESEQTAFSKWHDISVGLEVEVEEDFFELWPQHAKTREQLQAELAKEAKAFSNLYANYTGARDEIRELKKELDEQKRTVRNCNEILKQRYKEFFELGENIREVVSERDSCSKLNRLQQETISRLRQLCGEAADWMKNEIIHESEAETALREELHMQSHR